ncbi:DUF397 domain-containing protein [Streptomyces sp. V3I7]|uniref:DUF397 domain-containing protein n=1 Tax=Streptomyces sp. V3I7 TaxID=3042278 RepID=UPI0027810483|nr:DUF397 domain-containing protein [Streptomyces sp. V3I7]MDQ0990572.1 hypothetical protein [Streptomyces sp. V3I7]
MSTAEPAPLAWFKSSYSGNEGGACVEAAVAPGAVHIRDSKNPTRAQLAFHPTEWTAFLRYAVVR